MEDLCVLIPVWRDYRWLAPLTLAHLENSGPRIRRPFSSDSRRPKRSARRTSDQQSGTPRKLELDGAGRRPAGLDAVSKAYLIAEEHLPLAPCHSLHLNRPFPRSWNGGKLFISV